MSQVLEIFTNHSHWNQIKEILDKLHSSGFTAYLAGGCIRDALLNKNPKDFDIATSAQPREVLALFPKSRIHGKVFGVVAVVLDKEHVVEVATFRKDGPYQDGRHPISVTFSSEKEDALRRDFTVNALFYDVQEKKILDYVGGQKDLENKIIRTVGSPLKRFQEDKLRMIRAIRFSIQFDFQLDPATQNALFEHTNFLLDISKERIYEECLKILKTGKFVPALSAFKKLGLLNHLCSYWNSSDWSFSLRFWQTGIPIEWSQYNSFLWMYAFYPLLVTQSRSALRENGQWISGFYENLKAWRFPVKLIKSMRDMFYGSQCLVNTDQVSLGKKLIILNSPFSRQIMYLSRVYLINKNVRWDYLQQLTAEFQIRAPKGHLPKPLVNGEDLKHLGVPQDHNMSIKLDQLYELQLEERISDKKQLLKKWKGL